MVITDLYKAEYLAKENARLDSIITILEVNEEMYQLVIEDGLKNEENYLGIISNLHQEIEIYKFDLKQNKKRIRGLKAQNLLLKIGLGLGAGLLVHEMITN